MGAEIVSAVGKKTVVGEDGKPILLDGKEQVQERPVKVEFDFGGDLEGLIEILDSAHGEGAGKVVCFHHAKSAIKISLQNSMRAWAVAGLTADQIGEKLGEWEIPSGQTRAKSKMEKVSDLLGKMTAEERESVLALIAESESGPDDEPEELEVEEEELEEEEAAASSSA